MEPILDTLQTRFIVAHRNHLGPEWSAHDKPQPYGRLYLLSKGDCIVIHHDQSFHLQPGTVHVIPAGTALEYRCPVSMDIDWIHFTAHVMGDVDLLAYLHSPFEYHPRSLRYTTAMFRRMEQLNGRTSPTDQLESSALVAQLLSPFADLPRHCLSRPLASTMSDVISYLDAHMGQDIGVPDLAEHAALSREVFTRQFTAAFGRPPAQFIRHRRVEAARRILLTTDKSLAEIATDLGFSDAFHFSRVFKSLTGVSPAVFRRRGLPQP